MSKEHLHLLCGHILKLELIDKLHEKLIKFLFSVALQSLIQTILPEVVLHCSFLSVDDAWLLFAGVEALLLTEWLEFW